MTGKVLVVTGANKGIGYAIVRSLAQKVDGGVIYLTSRNVKLGEESLNKIKEELGDKQNSEILYHQLDITDEASCQTFANYLKEKHGGIDVLINNAGFAYQQASTEPAELQAKITIDINYYGTKRITNHLVPLIHKGGRIVNVCSQNGHMREAIFSKVSYGDKWIQYMTNPNITEKEIDDFVEEYRKAAKDGNRKELGFPESAYRVSKTAEIAYTLLQSKAFASKNILVNACCPGYVSTDMTLHKAPLSIDEGADTPVYLAIEPNVPNGEFIYQRQPVAWY